MTDQTLEVSLVLPVKETWLAKSRLAMSQESRRRIALALAYQSLDVATTCLPPDQVYVVTSDPTISQRVRSRGARLVYDGEVGGLNRAAERGIAEATARSPEHTVVTMVADLPELTVDALCALLQVVQDARCEPIYVADRSGKGTTIVSSPPGFLAQMVFGQDSAARFAALGHRAAHRVPTSLRADFDTLEDLWLLTAERQAALVGRPELRVGHRSA